HREVAGPHREVAGPHREVAGPQREMVGPQREMVGRQREVVGPQREVAGPHREVADLSVRYSDHPRKVTKSQLGMADLSVNGSDLKGRDGQEPQLTFQIRPPVPNFGGKANVE